jgi:hypothetical protein
MKSVLYTSYPCLIYSAICSIEVYVTSYLDLQYHREKLKLNDKIYERYIFIIPVVTLNKDCSTE